MWHLANPGGGINAATGYRYWTISVSNLEAIVAEAKAAGYQVPWEPREIRAGVSVAMVEDPEGVPELSGLPTTFGGARGSLA